MTYFDPESQRTFESYEAYERERLAYYVWTRYEKALTALLMIENNEHGEAWSAGVAMSARCSIEETGYPKPHPLPDLFGPYTMGAKLCDADGIVRSGRFFKGTEYPCTGHAHFAGEHIECTSPAHAAGQAAYAAPRDASGFWWGR